MKKTSKFAVLFLSVLFLLGACQVSEPEVVPEYDSEPVDLDLEGSNIVWGYASSDVIYGYIEGTIFADMALAREKEVEDKLNCNIEVQYVDGAAYSGLTAGVMSGSPIYDLVTGATGSLVDSVRAGYLTGLSSHIDASNTFKWGTPSVLQALLWKDDLYGVTSFAWPELIYGDVGFPILVNGNLLTRYGHDDPREYVENGTWTWDKFEEVLHEYTHQEADRTIYAMAVHSPWYSIGMFLSNGVSYSVFYEDNVAVGFHTPPGVEALERAYKIYKETCKDCFHPADAHGGVGVDLFVNGDVMMLTAAGGEVIGSESSVFYRLDNVALLPYPLGPNAEPGVYRSEYSGLTATVIPINVKEPEACITILSEMYEPFEGYESEQDVIDYMATNVFFDKRDAEVFYNMVSNTQYSFFGEGLTTAVHNLMSTNETVNVFLQGLEEKNNKLLEDYLIPHYEGRVAVYGE